MQDIHSIDNGAGGRRFFTGDGDRRLRPHHHDLKCPRCESVNTKFCYYNNYNLSQPRHFCKSCRRYWTKGGVLRNVPVGGGIRKAKRSKAKSKNDFAVVVAAAADVPRERKSSNSENSSSDSSSLTAANTTARIIPNSAAPELSGSNSINSTPTLLNFNESSTRFFGIPHSSAPITTFDPLISNQSSTGNMPPEIGTFTSLMNSSTDQLGFNVAGDISSFTLHQQDPNPNPLQWMHTDVKMPEMASVGFMDHDQTAEIELGGLGSRRSNGGLAGTEYDQGLFDLTGTVDQSYWGQSQWNVHDHGHPLNYLP